MRSIMDLLGRLKRTDPPPPPDIDREALRFEMAQTDPAYTHVRDVHHDALQAISAGSIADGVSIRREREWWQRNHPRQDQPNGGQKPC